MDKISIERNAQDQDFLDAPPAVKKLLLRSHCPGQNLPSRRNTPMRRTRSNPSESNRLLDVWVSHGVSNTRNHNTLRRLTSWPMPTMGLKPSTRPSLLEGCPWWSPANPRWCVSRSFLSWSSGESQWNKLLDSTGQVLLNDHVSPLTLYGGWGLRGNIWLVGRNKGSWQASWIWLVVHCNSCLTSYSSYYAETFSLSHLPKPWQRWGRECMLLMGWPLGELDLSGNTDQDSQSAGKHSGPSNQVSAHGKEHTHHSHSSWFSIEHACSVPNQDLKRLAGNGMAVRVVAAAISALLLAVCPIKMSRYLQ